MKGIYLTFIFCIFFVSCGKDLITPSEPCDLDCTEWEQCASQLIDPNDWIGPTRWICESVLLSYYHRTFYISNQTITNDSGFTSTDNVTMYVDNIYDENKITLTIYQQWNERYDLKLEFLNPYSGEFNVLEQSVYNPVLNKTIFYVGNGSFVKTGSTTYTLELNLSYQYNNMNYNMNLIGSD